MKNILFLMTDLEGGGAEKSLILLLKAFDYSKYKVTLCLLFHRGIYLNDIPKQVKVVYLFKSEDSSWNREAVRKYYRHHNPIIYLILFHLKLRRKYDVIISFMEGRPAMLHSHMMNRGKKNLSWIHCDLLNYHSSHTCYDYPVKEREFYERMDKLVFVSQKAMDGFQQLYGIGVPKTYLYNIVNKENICRLSEDIAIPKSRFTITAIGSLYEVKGFDRLVRVAKQLKDDGYSCYFQIIGEGDERLNLERFINENNLNEDVKLLGFQTNPYPYLKESDLLLSTSRSEGLSYVICEALTLGIPVVATKTAGALELLGEGEYGVLVEHEVVSISESIKKVIDNPAYYEILKKKSIIRSGIFDMRKTLDQVCQLID